MNHESIVLAFFCSIPFLLASMMKKAAKDKFPTLECCILAFWYAIFFSPCCPMPKNKAKNAFCTKGGEKFPSALCAFFLWQSTFRALYGLLPKTL